MTTSVGSEIAVYLLRYRSYDGFNKLTATTINALGTVRKISWRGPLRVKNLRRFSGRVSWKWTYNTHLKYRHTRLVLQRRLACWTTHARCGKCQRAT